MRHLAIEVGDPCVDSLFHSHRASIDDAHSRLELMTFLKGITSCVGHKETAFIESNPLWLVAHFTSGNNLESANVNLCHKTLVEVNCPFDCLAFVSVTGDVDVLSVAAKPAVVGNVLCRGNCFAIRVDELHNVRPVDGNGNEGVVNLYDVVRRIAKFHTVSVPEPLVADYRAVLKVAESPIVGLPHAFVQEDNLLLRARVTYI